MDMPVAMTELTDVISFGAEHSSLGPLVARAVRASGMTISPDPLPEETVFVRSDEKERWAEALRGGQVAWFVPVGVAWQETDAEVKILSQPRTENVRVARRDFRVGNLYINRGTTGALVERQPFGGFLMSGVGSKAGGPDYMLQFLEPRSITENTMRRGFAPLEES